GAHVHKASPPQIGDAKQFSERVLSLADSILIEDAQESLPIPAKLKTLSVRHFPCERAYGHPILASHGFAPEQDACVSTHRLIVVRTQYLLSRTRSTRCARGLSDSPRLTEPRRQAIGWTT